MLHSLKQQDVIEALNKNVYVGIGGKYFSADGAQVLAKTMNNQKGCKYFCKFNTTGVEAGHLVNPWSMYADEAVTPINKMNNKTGKFEQEYKEVSKEVFDLYVRYMSSQSDVHYRQAERGALEWLR
jgi:hypothetical protein